MDVGHGTNKNNYCIFRTIVTAHSPLPLRIFKACLSSHWGKYNWATGKPVSCSSNGKWSSITTSKWGWLRSFFGGQRSTARQLAEFISLWSMPLLVAECQGEVSQWETASLSVGGMSFSLSFTQAHWFPLEVQLPLPQILLCTTGDISFKKRTPQQTCLNELMKNRGTSMSLGISRTNISSKICLENFVC